MARIVHIRHETEDLTEYSATQTDSGDLSVTSGAALASTGFGLQCFIDGTGAIYGEKTFTTPTSDDTRIRIYFDVNSLTMGTGDKFQLWELAEAGVGARYVLQIREDSGNYQVASRYQTDGGLTDGGWVTITDAPHYIEMHITRATTNSASDGTVLLYVDGSLVDTASSLDIFDVTQPDRVRVGAQSGLDSGTSGTFYIDELIVRDDSTEIGAFVPPSALGRIVHIRHEMGDLTEYTSTVTDSGDLSVEVAAGLAGTGFGLQFVVDDTTDIYAVKEFTALGASPSDCRARFYIDPNSLTMANNDNFQLCRIRQKSTGHKVALISLARSSGGVLRFDYISYSDGGTFDTQSSSGVITDAPHYVEVHIKKASTEFASDGEIKYYIDGVLSQTHSNIDIFDTFELIDQVHIGAIIALDAGTSGTFYMDELIVRDDATEIGAFVPPTSVGRIVHIRHETEDLTEYTSTVTDSGDLSADAAAGLAGTGFGLQCLIDSTGSIYGTKAVDFSSAADLRIRFYIDVNTLTMANNDKFDILRVRQSSGDQILALEMLFQTGPGYRITFNSNSDDGFNDSTAVTITDEPHYVEIHITKASTEFAADAEFKFYVDGVLEGTHSSIDLFDDFAAADLVYFGAVNGVDAGTSGTLFLDELIIRDDDTEIGAFVPASPAGRIVHIRHETEDLTEYDATITDSGDLSVDAAAALAGTGFGLQAVIDDANVLTARKNFTALGASLTDLRIRFYIDPNGITMASGDQFLVLELWRNSGSENAHLIELKHDGSNYQLISTSYDDGGFDAVSTAQDITDAPHYVEIHIAKASTEFASDGEVKWYIDGVLQQTRSNVDIFDGFALIDGIALAPRFGIDAGTSGTLFLDELIVRDDSTEIGAFVPPTSVGRIVHIRHETEDLTEYDSTATDGGDLSVASGAALASTGFGLQCVIDDTTELSADVTSGIDLSSAADVRYRFYIDVNSLTMGTNEQFEFAHMIYISGLDAHVQHVLKYTGSAYELRFQIREDLHSFQSNVDVEITDAPHYVEVLIKKASTEFASDGVVTCWIDGSQVVNVTGLDIFDSFALIDRWRWGCGVFGTLDAGTSGTFYLDELIIRDDDTEIGAYVTPTSVGRIVHIRHETEDLTEYDSTVTDTGDLSVEVAAALAGTGFGLQLVVDDATSIYGQIDTVTATADMRARFYIDPNAMAMANNDQMNVFTLEAGGSGPLPGNIFIIALKFTTVEGYRINMTSNDDTTSTAFGNIDISDAPHYIEVHLEKASTEFASDGRLRVWVDGVLGYTRSNVDFFDVFPDMLRHRFGAQAIDAGTSGTFFLDELIVRDDDTEIGAYVTPTSVGEIVNIDHEGGGLSEYDSTVTDGGDLSVEIAAGLAGTRFGLQVDIDSNGAIYGQKNFTALSAATDTRWRFYFDSNSISMDDGQNHRIFDLRVVSSGDLILTIRLARASGAFRIFFDSQSDGTVFNEQTDVALSDEPHFIEFHVKKASTEFAADGEFKFYLDGALVGTHSNVDIFDTFVLVDNVRMGATGAIDTGTRGIYFCDELIGRDDAILIGLHMSGLGSFRGAVASAASSSDATAIDATSRDAGA